MFDQLLARGQCVEALHQLPADNPDFTDRVDEKRQLLAVLDRDPEPKPEGTTAATVVITGPPMSGKSQLAIHLAHETKSRYPNGQFIIDLGGPLEPSHAVADGLTDLLRGQGVPLRRIPETRELALKRYYSWFHGKQALVVIENAADAEHTRLFLPPERGCAAIVTGKSLADLGTDCRSDLEPFSRPDAAELLHKLDRSTRRAWTVEDPSAIQIVEWCECCPVVIASVAAWMSMPRVADLSLAEIAEKLSQGDTAHDVLASSPLWKSLQLHCEALEESSPEAARLFRLLGLLGPPDVDMDVVMALARWDRNTAEGALNVLVDARLLEMDGVYFRMPAMYRPFAEDRARAEEGNAKCREALKRAFTHYLERDEPWATARAAEALETIDRLSRERINLVTAVTQAFNEEFYDLAWRLSVKCAQFFKAHRYVGAWEATAQIGRDAADHLNQADHRLEALTLTHVNLGCALHAQGRLDEAMESYGHSVRRIDELVHLGLAYEQQGNLDSARSCLEHVERLASYPEFISSKIRPSVDRAEVNIATLRARVESHGMATGTRTNEASTRTVESTVRGDDVSHEAAGVTTPRHPDLGADRGSSADAGL